MSPTLCSRSNVSICAGDVQSRGNKVRYSKTAQALMIHIRRLGTGVLCGLARKREHSFCMSSSTLHRNNENAHANPVSRFLQFSDKVHTYTPFTQGYVEDQAGPRVRYDENIYFLELSLTTRHAEQGKSINITKWALTYVRPSAEECESGGSRCKVQHRRIIIIITMHKLIV